MYPVCNYLNPSIDPTIMYIAQTDAIREWQYDRTSSIGHLEKGLDDAVKNNWLVVDMKKDWKEVFAK